MLDVQAASVVFFRAVNVGKYQRFQPAQLARDLHALDVRNIGAAGTLVVRRVAGENEIREEIGRRLSFSPEFFIRPVDSVLALRDDDPFAAYAESAGVKPYLSVLGSEPQADSLLPHGAPAGEDWEVRVIRRVGTFALSVRRMKEGGRWYPNEVVERHFGVPATTRGWGIVDQIARSLESR